MEPTLQANGGRELFSWLSHTSRRQVTLWGGVAGCRISEVSVLILHS